MLAEVPSQIIKDNELPIQSERRGKSLGFNQNTQTDLTALMKTSLCIVLSNFSGQAHDHQVTQKRTTVSPTFCIFKFCTHSLKVIFNHLSYTHTVFFSCYYSLNQYSRTTIYILLVL